MGRRDTRGRVVILVGGVAGLAAAVPLRADRAARELPWATVSSLDRLRGQASLALLSEG